MKPFALLICAVILAACHNGQPAIYDGGSDGPSASKSKDAALPIGRPDGPYKPGSTAVWQNDDGTVGAIKVNPKSDDLTGAMK